MRDILIALPDAAAHRVTVIVPFYNQAQFVLDRLSSIVLQKAFIKEVIVLDDCSSDATVAAIESFPWGDVSYKLVSNDRNSGSPFVQWAKGLGLAKSELIWIAEGDDSSRPGFLKSAVEAFNSDSEVDVYCCNSEPIDAEGNILESTPVFSQNFIYQAIDFSRIYLDDFNRITNASSVVFKSSVAENVCASIATFRWLGDHLFYRIIMVNSRKIFTESLAYNLHRRHSGCVTWNSNVDVKIDELYKLSISTSRYTETALWRIYRSFFLNIKALLGRKKFMLHSHRVWALPFFMVVSRLLRRYRSF